MIRVLVVDDHHLVRAGLVTLLEADKGIQVSGQAEGGQQAVEVAVATAPDVVLMDLSMPGLDGVAATRLLLAAVRAAADGHVPLDPRVAAALLPSRAPAPADQLSEREKQVLRLVSAGLANKQIARRLGITESTVKVHTGSIFRRIGVTGRTSAAVWAKDHL